MPKTTKVKVEQKDGEITVSHGGVEPRTYHVTDGTVSVAEEDLELFLRAVPGSTVESSGARSTGKE